MLSPAKLYGSWDRVKLVLKVMLSQTLSFFGQRAEGELQVHAEHLVVDFLENTRVVLGTLTS